MDKFAQPQTYQKSSFEMKCMKILLISINILYLIISFLMISGATTLKVIFGQYYYVLWYASSIDSLSSLWIATGCLLLALSIFGIAAAIKESTAMTNFYGLTLSLIFILQVAAAIKGFSLKSQTDGLVRYSLQSMMYRSGYSQDSMDPTLSWIQQTFQCCGNDGPSDWGTYGNWKFSATATPAQLWTDDDASTLYGEDRSPTDETTTTRMTPDYRNKMPPSCCTPYSSYDSDSLQCQNYYTRGCHAPLNEILSESVTIWGTSALIIAVVQILGVVCAFTFARTIRREKTNRDIHRWAVNESLGSDRPTYADQLRNSEPNADQMKYI